MLSGIDFIDIGKGIDAFYFFDIGFRRIIFLCHMLIGDILQAFPLLDHDVCVILVSMSFRLFLICIYRKTDT